MKIGVGGEGAVHVDAGGAGDVDRGLDEADLLVAEPPALAGVRVETRDGDPRVAVDAQLSTARLVPRDRSGSKTRPIVSTSRSFISGTCAVASATRSRGETNIITDRFALRAVGEQLGMPGPVEARHLPRVLADRGGHDRVEMPRVLGRAQGVGDRLLDEGLRRQPPRFGSGAGGDSRCPSYSSKSSTTTPSDTGRRSRFESCGTRYQNGSSSCRSAS